MKAEIISIGDELLIGQTVNTNAAWLGEQMAERGVTVNQVQTIKDEESAIVLAIELAMRRADFIVVTGGLGPTKDDITKQVLCRYFNTKLEINFEVLAHVKHIFESRGKRLLEVNEQQAMLPKKCTILRNEIGTAPGMWFEKGEKVLVSLPGVPYEMENIFSTQVIPLLTERFNLISIYHETINIQGLGESFLADKISDIEDEVRAEGIGLAFLPSAGKVRLRLTSEKTEERIERVKYFLDKISNRLPKYVYSREKSELNVVIGELLKRKGATLGTVESCTGGAIAGEVVKVSGASEYFSGSIVSYDNKLKQELVEVNEQDIIKFGAVSKEVVSQMAINGKRKLGVDYCIATSGVAGPNGGTANKPVGTVWIAIAHPEGLFTRCFLFTNNRERNIKITVLTALNLLRRVLLEIKFEKS